MKTLLTVLDINDQVNKLDPVIQYAQGNNAHLNIVALGVLPNVTMAVSPGVPAYQVHELHKEIIQAGKEAVPRIETYLIDRDVRGSVVLEFADSALVERAISRHASLSDATIFRPGNLTGPDSKARSFHGALLNSGRPVIIIDDQESGLTSVEKVTLAWNGEDGAAKAMHHALAFFDQLSEIGIVVVDPRDHQTGPNPGDDVASFLARRDLKVSVERLPSRQRDPMEVVFEHANDAGSDLVVMGALSRSRLSEWLLGSSTRYAIENAKLPLLMAR